MQHLWSASEIELFASGIDSLSCGRNGHNFVPKLTQITTVIRLLQVKTVAPLFGNGF